MFSIDEYFGLILGFRLNDARAYRIATVPDFLCKFYPLSENGCENEKRFGTLSRNAIWFSEPGKMNDPFEFKTIFFDRDEVAKKMTEEGVDFYQGLFDAGIQNHSLASFSANAERAIPLWAHYANNHHGFCVRFHIDKKDNFRNVVYEDTRIPLNKLFFDMEEERIRITRRGGNGLGITQFVLAAITDEQFYLKHSSWQYESEYRCVLDTDGKDQKSFEMSCDEIGLVVDKVIAGYNCTLEHFERLCSICNTNGWPQPSKASLSRTKFLVEENC